jgi:hypothetical protein
MVPDLQTKPAQYRHCRGKMCLYRGDFGNAGRGKPDFECARHGIPHARKQAGNPPGGKHIALRDDALASSWSPLTTSAPPFLLRIPVAVISYFTNFYLKDKLSAWPTD